MPYVRVVQTVKLVFARRGELRFVPQWLLLATKDCAVKRTCFHWLGFAERPEVTQAACASNLPALPAVEKRK